MFEFYFPPRVSKVSENTIYFAYVCAIRVCVCVNYVFQKHNFNNHVLVLLFNLVLYIVISPQNPEFIF